MQLYTVKGRDLKSSAHANSVSTPSAMPKSSSNRGRIGTEFSSHLRGNTTSSAIDMQLYTVKGRDLKSSAHANSVSTPSAMPKSSSNRGQGNNDSKPLELSLRIDDIPDDVPKGDDGIPARPKNKNESKAATSVPEHPRRASRILSKTAKREKINAAQRKLRIFLVIVPIAMILVCAITLTLFLQQITSNERYSKILEEERNEYKATTDLNWWTNIVVIFFFQWYSTKDCHTCCLNWCCQKQHVDSSVQ